MSHDHMATNNKNRKYPKVFFQQYLSNLREPEDDVSSDTPPELEVELLENSYAMRHQLRHIAQRLRDRYL